MNEWINQITKGGDVWSRLLKTDKKVLIYGMGNGAEKLLDVCGKRGIKISGVFCSDGFERGKTFRGFYVEGMTKTLEKFADPIILIAFGTREKSALDLLFSLTEKYEVYAPDLPVYCESVDVDSEIFDLDFFEKNKEKIIAARKLFSDEKSLGIFDHILAYKLRGTLDLLKAAVSEDLPEPFEKDLKICVDAGAYRGDTIEERLKNSPCVEKVFAIEPDEKNAEKLRGIYGGDGRISVVKAAAGAEEKRAVFMSGNGRGGALGSRDLRAKRRLVDILPIDEITRGEAVDFIKYDVEGAEREALAGSAGTIKNHLPYLRVSLYHKTADLFELPLFVNELSGGKYVYFLRRKFCVPAWETDLICVNKNHV